MKTKPDKIRFDLRLTNIPLSLKDSIALTFSKLKFTFSNRAYKDNDMYILIFNLEENDLNLINVMIDEFGIKNINCDFFFSLTTYKDISGISVPKQISDFINKLGGGIEISVINLM